ncbi:MAG TPA: STAS/SEC14 domain-containing protein [Prolixibacteraceae bacterium]|nr:STAS/SEC14 domain-containing protein [Prolixibacteraceae bacterium]
MFKVLDLTYNNLIAVEIDGQIKKEDYDKVNPLIEKAVKEHGKVKLYLYIAKIEGIDAKAFLEDVKTYFRHFNDMEKIAVVGDNDWQKFWSNLAGPFVSGKLNYFNKSETAEAQIWIRQ